MRKTKLQLPLLQNLNFSKMTVYYYFQNPVEDWGGEIALSLKAIPKLKGNACVLALDVPDDKFLVWDTDFYDLLEKKAKIVAGSPKVSFELNEFLTSDELEIIRALNTLNIIDLKAELCKIPEYDAEADQFYLDYSNETRSEEITKQLEEIITASKFDI